MKKIIVLAIITQLCWSFWAFSMHNILRFMSKNSVHNARLSNIKNNIHTDTEFNARLLIQKIESNKLQKEHLEIKRVQFCLDYLRTHGQYPWVCNTRLVEQCKKYLETFTLPGNK